MQKKKKTVLVTGAASGIGLAITNYLVSHGDHVIAVDINEKALNALNKSDLIAPFVMDITKLASINYVVKEIQKNFSGLDGLVNNAGIFVGGPLIEVEEKEVEKILDVNVLGTFQVTKAMFPLLHKNKGRIVNMGSETGRFAFPLNGPYTMSKFAIEAFSDSLRRELMFLDMKVIHLQLGAVKTQLLADTLSCYTDNFDHENSLFKNQLKTVTKVCEDEVQKGTEPEYVAKLVYRILHKKHPRARYKVKVNKLRRFLEFLPTPLVDYAMKLILK
ncbi:MAG: SDR family NAD(P)-dependent oxidoreductase [Candidatus Heimdallarchaeota archaeon]